MNKIFACSPIPYQRKIFFAFSISSTPLLRGIAKIHILQSLIQVITEILLKDFSYMCPGASAVKDLVYTLFLYKNNFIRTEALIAAKKLITI